MAFPFYKSGILFLGSVLENSLFLSAGKSMTKSLLPHYSGIQYLVLDGMGAFHCFLQYSSL